jgi:hypothetical protein
VTRDTHHESHILVKATLSISERPIVAGATQDEGLLIASTGKEKRRLVTQRMQRFDADQWTTQHLPKLRKALPVILPPSFLLPLLFAIPGILAELLARLWCMFPA